MRPALTNGQDVSMTFVLTNRSDKIVKLVNVDTSCRCPSVEKPFKASGDRWIGAKAGLIATAPASAANTGYAEFDWFRVTP